MQKENFEKRIVTPPKIASEELRKAYGLLIAHSLALLPKLLRANLEQELAISFPSLKNLKSGCSEKQLKAFMATFIDRRQAAEREMLTSPEESWKEPEGYATAGFFLECGYWLTRTIFDGQFDVTQLKEQLATQKPNLQKAISEFAQQVEKAFYDEKSKPVRWNWLYQWDDTTSPYVIYEEMALVERGCLRGDYGEEFATMLYKHWILLVKMERGESSPEDSRISCVAAFMAGRLAECLNTFSLYEKASHCANYAVRVTQNGQLEAHIPAPHTIRAIYRANAFRFLGVTKKHYQRRLNPKIIMPGIDELAIAMHYLQTSKETRSQSSRDKLWHSTHCDLLHEILRLCCSSIETLWDYDFENLERYKAAYNRVNGCLTPLLKMIWPQTAWEGTDPLAALFDQLRRKTAASEVEIEQRLIYYDTLGRAELFIQPEQAKQPVKARVSDARIQLETIDILHEAGSFGEITSMEIGWRDQLEVRIAGLEGNAINDRKALSIMVKGVQEARKKKLSHAVKNFESLNKWISPTDRLEFQKVLMDENC